MTFPALGELRGELRHAEKEALHAVDDAISEIKKASIDDGKDLNDHLPVDAGLDYMGRLRRAKELLEKARQDIAREGDHSFGRACSSAPLAPSTKRFTKSNRPSGPSLRASKPGFRS